MQEYEVHVTVEAKEVYYVYAESRIEALSKWPDHEPVDVHQQDVLDIEIVREEILL